MGGSIPLAPEGASPPWSIFVGRDAAFHRNDQTQGSHRLPAVQTAQLRSPPAPALSRLKELGKIPKSDFLLRYTDILELRQAIEQQLNKGENVNKFARAVSFGNSQEFLHGEKIEQEIAEGCRRLIKNAIICWNYLYLTQKIAEAESDERRQELLTAVRNGSVVTWQHINLHGATTSRTRSSRTQWGYKRPQSWLYMGYDHGRTCMLSETAPTWVRPHRIAVLVRLFNLTDPWRMHGKESCDGGGRIGSFRAKVAVTMVVSSVSRIRLQGPVPGQSARLQPVKVEPSVGLAVSVTRVPIT